MFAEGGGGRGELRSLTVVTFSLFVRIRSHFLGDTWGSWRGRLGIQLCGVALLGAVAAACGSSAESAAGNGNSGQSTTSTSSSPTTASGTPSCTTSSLSLSQDTKQFPSASGHSATFFGVTNTGSAACQLSGYPLDVQVFGSDGANLQVKVQDAAPGAQFLLTAPPVAPVVVAPHQAAFFALTWTDEVIPSPSGGQAPACPEGTKLQASIGGGPLQAPATLPQLCNSSATVTAFASASANWGATSP